MSLVGFSMSRHCTKPVGGIRLRWVGVASAVLLAAGCTMIPKYERPAAPVPGQYPGSPATNQTDVADIAWRTFFAEERLHELIEVALANNRDLRVAVLNVEQS